MYERGRVDSPDRDRDNLRRFLLVTAFTASTVAFAVLYLPPTLRYRTYLGDYIIFWQAGSGWPLYRNLHELTFPYPPTALLLVKPFGSLPFVPAVIAWTLAGVALLYVTSRRLVTPKAAAIGMLSCAVLWLALSGQVSGFVAACVIGGLTARRPWQQGLLFALAGIIKPQSVLMVPVALLAERNWRVAAWGALFGALLVGISVALWGADLWPRWLHILRDFPALLAERQVNRADVGVAGLALKLGLPSWLFVLGIPLGIACVWRTFRRQADDAERYTALVCGVVLCSPYVLGYDLAALSIVCVGFLLDREQSKSVWRASAMIVSSVLTAPGVVLMAVELARLGNFNRLKQHARISKIYHREHANHVN